jgi:type I site-specific restriction endonuclease
MDLINNLPVLNLPTFNVKLKDEQQRTQIYDAFRNKFVNLTPEEWVRQHILHYLTDIQKIAKNKIAVEFSLKLNGLQKRADIVVFNNEMNPQIIVECKSIDVKITSSIFEQAARYNLVLKVPYLIISNGLSMHIAEIDFKNEQTKLLNEFPSNF